jgi:hypothetical protein
MLPARHPTGLALFPVGSGLISHPWPPEKARDTFTPVRLARIFKVLLKKHMENLKTESIEIDVEDGIEQYDIREKDHGDLVVYDIYRKDHYLLTLSGDGSILFMNFDADEKDREVFKLSRLNRFIEKIKEHS